MRLPLLLLLAVALSAVEEGPFPVLKVIDGDTIEVEREGKPQRVRLLYVDTPEASDNDHGKLMPEGQKAKEFLRDLLPEGFLVKLEDDQRERLTRDRHGRILAIVWKAERRGHDLDGIPSVQESIISAGWSPYWQKYGTASFRLDDAWSANEELAREAKRGAWATAPDWMRDKANERTAAKGEK